MPYQYSTSPVVFFLISEAETYQSSGAITNHVTRRPARRQLEMSILVRSPEQPCFFSPEQPSVRENFTLIFAAMDFSNIRDQVSNLTLYDIKAGVRKVQNGECWTPMYIFLSTVPGLYAMRLGAYMAINRALTSSSSS